MKKLALSIFTASTIFLFFSCGGGSTEQQSQTATQDTAGSYAPSQPAAPYDPSKIDATAPVM